MFQGKFEILRKSYCKKRTASSLPLWHPVSCSAFCRSFYNLIVKYPFGLGIRVPKYVQISFFSICFAHLGSNSQVKQFSHLHLANMWIWHSLRVRIGPLSLEYCITNSVLSKKKIEFYNYLANFGQQWQWLWDTLYKMLSW